ncbi:hypothetical protein ACSTS3_14345 [Aquimarina muelleri]|uniref:hypothetical protein n=1 Tax=Aquimarina muelleri TaxID=279356 RepID=UPI003F682D58
MKTYFNHHDIYTNHIFDFETDCFFHDPIEYEKKQTRRILSQLIQKLKFKIISSTNPEESDSYTYLKNFTITLRCNDFDYWFALKLRQYQIGLKYIYTFLNYHLANSFNNNIKKFNEFLELVILQYENIFFNKNVSKVIKKYKKKELIQKRISHDIKVRKPKTTYNTFLLKNLQTNSNYIRDNIVDFMDIWSLLKKESFIDKNTSFENFKAIFKNQKIEPIDRIKWAGTNKELQWFVKYLVYKSEKTVNLDKDIWLVTRNCFIKNDGKGFTESQLRNASGDRLNRKKSVERILSKI